MKNKSPRMKNEPSYEKTRALLYNWGMKVGRVLRLSLILTVWI